MSKIPRTNHLWAAFLTLPAFALSQVHAVPIVGDTVTTHLTVNGNTTASGWGLFKEGIDFGTNGEAMLNWWPGTATAGTASFDIKLADGTFLWRDTATATTASNKMGLDAENSLTLYKADGSTIGLTLNPNVGITLGDGTQIKNAASLRSSALYDSSGNLAASVAADGSVKFTGGITFGSDPSVKLKASNVAALQSTLKNLGYQENPVIGTAVKKLAIHNAAIGSVVTSGSFIYIVGTFTNSANIGGLSITSAGGSDGFVAKCDANGSVRWVKAIGGTSSDFAKSVAVDSGGNVFVGGSFMETTTNLSGSNILSAGSDDAYVTKFDPNGTVLWAKAIGGISTDVTTSVSVDGSGNVLVGGTFRGTTTSLGAANVGSAGDVDGFVAKFDSAGAVQWAKAIGGVWTDTISSTSVDGSGNILVGGGFSGATTNLLGSNIVSAGNFDGYVVKLNSSGAVQWAKAIGGIFDEYVTSVTTASGNVFVGGTFDRATTNLGPANLTSAGITDGFVAKFDPTGAVQWARAIGGPSYDDAASVTVDSIGNAFVGGSFDGAINNLGAANLTNGGVKGGYVVQFASNGSIVDAISLGELGAYKSVTGLALSGSDIYAWGNAQSTFAFGNTRVPTGDFVLGWPAFRVITPARIAATPLAWAGSAAVGFNSTALGGNAYAEGGNSTALGNGIATGTNSFAAGAGKATGLNSVALGIGKAFGISSSAFGGSVASGNYSFAAGSGSSASGWGAVALGYNNVASSGYATAFGGNNKATGSGSTVSGFANTVSGTCATAFGTFLTAQSSNSFVLGAYNLAQGTPGPWIPTDDLFVMGNGESDTLRSNAFTTLKNGQTTVTNKEWKTATTASPGSVTAALANPASLTDSDGNALVVEGHTLLKGKVTLAVPQGDISMGIYQ